MFGEHLEWKGSGLHRKCTLKKDEMMYIPLLKTLECLLKSDTIRNEVYNAE